MAKLNATLKGVTPGQHSFAQVPRAEIQRSVFDRSCGVKTTFDSGYLVPIFVDEALPGDTMTLRTSSFSRLATPIVPIMDNVWMDFFFFAVPYRLVWDNWQKFNGEQDNPGDSTDFTVPQFVNEVVVTNSLSDYMGVPISVNGGGTNTFTFNSLHHRAYNLIFNTWFRSEDLTNSAVVDTDNGPDTLSDYVLRRRTKRHDYFSSCLPFTQKGTVTLPIGTVTGDGSAPTFSVNSVTKTLQQISGGVGAVWSSTNAGATADALWVNPHLTATLSSINSIRQAFQIQRLLERDARGGSRYTEILRSHFGVVSPDQRLQRPEYLGGGSTRIAVHPVARTTTTSSNGATAPPIGQLGAFATAAVDGVGFMKSFVEHCLIIGLVNVRADLNYQQGMPRMFRRRTRYDFFWPALAHLGEQAVLNEEIFAQGSTNPSQDAAVFGYQERYAEYRYKPSITTGQMRSQTIGGGTDVWHLALNFGSLPALNNTFIEDNPPFSRVLAVSAVGQQFIGDFFFEYRCARPMPTFGVPGFVDHF